MKPSADVTVVPVLKDNFSYIVVDEKTNKALCVDPAEPEKVLKKAEELGVDLEYVLCTHHHYDHSGGNIRMKQLKCDVKVYGSSYEQTPGVTHPISNAEIITIGDLRIKAIHAPCHTKGHILYYLYKTEGSEIESLNYTPLLFSGDTIFIAGCGRFFEGSAKEMFKNIQTVKSLRKETLIYCGHEYTLKNLQFTLSIEKDNIHAKQKIKEVEEKLRTGKHSVPSTVEQEMLINTFFRTNYYLELFNTNDEIEVMKMLRNEKDVF